jgi:hypothetical protein
VEPYSATLAIALAVAALASLSFKDEAKVVVALGLLLNWLINTIAVHVSGLDFPWPVFLMVDFTTACVILAADPPKTGLLIAASYSLQIVTHVAYGIAGAGPWHNYYYWWVLYTEAWLQIALLIVWFCHGGAKLRLRNIGSSRSPLASYARYKRMDEQGRGG